MIGPLQRRIRNELERDIAFGALVLAAGSLRLPPLDAVLACQPPIRLHSIPEMRSADARIAISHRYTEYIGARPGERKLALVYHGS